MSADSISLRNCAEHPSASTSYLPPTKHILSAAHLAAFQRSKTHAEIVDFVEQLNDSIVGRKLSDAGDGSEVSRRNDSSADASAPALYSTYCNRSWPSPRRHLQ
jgi:serine/threonine-protein phosphatase 2A activator